MIFRHRKREPGVISRLSPANLVILPVNYMCK
nr:MAG TPA: hypothetical protein [Bacteriophage sp.]